MVLQQSQDSFSPDSAYAVQGVAMFNANAASNSELARLRLCMSVRIWIAIFTFLNANGIKGAR